MNSPVDQALLTLVHQKVHSLENEFKNWSEELKEEGKKVLQQLQIFDFAFKEIKQRLIRLETGHQRLVSEQQRLETSHGRLETEQQRLETEQHSLKTGHQRLETEQQRLETGHQRLKTGHKRSKKDHIRLKTKQRRLESHSRDVEQRVIKCEGTPTFKKKGVYVICLVEGPYIKRTVTSVLKMLPSACCHR